MVASVSTPKNREKEGTNRGTRGAAAASAPNADTSATMSTRCEARGATKRPPMGTMRAMAQRLPAEAAVVPAMQSAANIGSSAGASMAAAVSAEPNAERRNEERVSGATQSSPRAGGALFHQAIESMSGKRKSRSTPKPGPDEARRAARLT